MCSWDSCSSFCLCVSVNSPQGNLQKLINMPHSINLSRITNPFHVCLHFSRASNPPEKECNAKANNLNVWNVHIGSEPLSTFHTDKVKQTQKQQVVFLAYVNTLVVKTPPWLQNQCSILCFRLAAHMKLYSIQGSSEYWPWPIFFSQIKQTELRWSEGCS